jgi:hypothetical protein
MVEFHVVRQGVDDKAIEELLAPLFEEIAVSHYWSTQSGLLQRLGDRFFPPNTFGIAARRRIGTPAV